MCTCGRPFCDGNCCGISPHILPMQPPMPMTQSSSSHFLVPSPGPSVRPVVFNLFAAFAAYAFLAWAIYNFIRAVSVHIYRHFTESSAYQISQENRRMDID